MRRAIALVALGGCVASSDAGGAGGAGADCDADRDGAISTACGGDDCCDTDAFTLPGASYFVLAPDACGSWDVDCNGAVEFEHPVASWCEPQPPGTYPTCEFVEGWLLEPYAPVPDCGEWGEFEVPTCAQGCAVESQMQQMQACR